MEAGLTIRYLDGVAELDVLHLLGSHPQLRGVDRDHVLVLGTLPLVFDVPK